MNSADRETIEVTWEWSLPGMPNVLWPALSDTDRFNQDAGLPAVFRLATPHKRAWRGGRVAPMKANGGQWLEAWAGPLRMRWREEPFSWIKGECFGVERHYLGGPLRSMLVQVALRPEAEGTRLTYSVKVFPRHPWFRSAIRLLLQHVVRPRFARAFQLAAKRALKQAPSQQTWALGGRERLRLRANQWLESGGDPASVAVLDQWIRQADDEAALRLRPYELTPGWAHLPSASEARRKALTACLQATKAGLLEMRWEPMCPFCRGAKGVARELGELRGTVHCDACHIDFATHLDRSVEVTFRAHRSLRSAERGTYCVGSPARTLHILLQQPLDSGDAWEGEMTLNPGRYRVRGAQVPGGLYVRVDAFTAPSQTETFTLSQEGWSREEKVLPTQARLRLRNETRSKAVLLLERLEAFDSAAMAADVLCLQSFQDLFGAETLRPGEQIEVTRLAFLFTDLKGSTRLYREVGDAKAFGLVMDHFAILQRCVAANGGTVVKTIGDAVLAVFTHPEAALQAAISGHRELQESGQAWILKAGIHCGPCIAVTQNDKLDYFGSTLNLAARLLNHCQGGDLVLSQAAIDDAGVQAWIGQSEHRSWIEDGEALAVTLKGFEGETHRLLRLPLVATGTRPKRNMPA
jgi:adenylate cyclase